MIAMAQTTVSPQVKTDTPLTGNGGPSDPLDVDIDALKKELGNVGGLTSVAVSSPLSGQGTSSSPITLNTSSLGSSLAGRVSISSSNGFSGNGTSSSPLSVNVSQMKSLLGISSQQILTTAYRSDGSTTNGYRYLSCFRIMVYNEIDSTSPYNIYFYQGVLDVTLTPGSTVGYVDSQFTPTSDVPLMAAPAFGQFKITQSGDVVCTAVDNGQGTSLLMKFTGIGW